jgi:recombination protein RecT
VRQQFDNALKDHSDAFIASMIDLFSTDTYLQQCDPNKVVMECLKAATLKLPLNRALGFAWVIPYKVKGQMAPQFQIGAKGYVQLAMRSGQYRYLNTGMVYEGQKVSHEIVTGRLSIDGEAKGQRVTGYFAYLELLNGFSKSIYMTADEVMAHAKRYSRAFGNEGSPWQVHFDAMAQKTVLRLLLSKFGILSTEMEMALTSDPADAEEAIGEEIAENANREALPAIFAPAGSLDAHHDTMRSAKTEQETGEVKPPWE